MLYTARAYNGMVVSPHRLASEAGLAVLRKGGNAIEAAVAAAAALCVAYPHMTGLGGDAVWLIMPSGRSPSADPLVIDACGRSARSASMEWYLERGLSALPLRGPGAALTMAGAVSGWRAALDVAGEWSAKSGRRVLGLDELFADALGLAEDGCPVTAMQSTISFSLFNELADLPGFARIFLPRGKPPVKGQRLTQPALARTMRRLADEGLDSFYRGALAKEMAAEMEAAGSPLRLEDFTAHQAETRQPLSVAAFKARIFNSPPPTQGLSSLMILALLERFASRTGCNFHDQASLAHAVVEATKQAFWIRNRYLADPAHMRREAEEFLRPEVLDPLAEAMSPDLAQPWPFAEIGREEGPREPGRDTVWFGAMDERGNAVSCIQSLYHEFGSGLALPGSGILWHNRGLGFQFSPGAANSLGPGKKPLHTLNPAMARLDDGRLLAYGTMGGDGQPQTQAAVFLRYVALGYPLQAAISEPRWLLGRAWGEQGHALKLERSFSPEVARQMRALGHEVETVPAFSSLMGHAGALVRHRDGLLEGGFDPRSDGAACCW